MLPPPWDLALLLLSVLLLLLINVLRKHSILITILILIFVLVIQDQMRWQPWVYIYGLMLLPFCFWKGQNFEVGEYLQVVMIGVYIWSGIHKINPGFVHVTFQSILRDFMGMNHPEVFNKLKYLGYFVPLIETVIGSALIFRASRNLAVYAGIAMHVFILLYLSPLGINHNIVVLPWNLAMIALLYVLFYNQQNKIGIGMVKKTYMGFLKMLSVLLIWLMPLLNFYGLWDLYPSFALYANKRKDFYVAVREDQLHRLGNRFDNYFTNIKGLQGGQLINVEQWALDVLTVPLYPEHRVFKKIGAYFCQYEMEEGAIYFLEFERPYARNKYTMYGCEEGIIDIGNQKR